MIRQTVAFWTGTGTAPIAGSKPKRRG
jgi:hypothetical protein